MPPILIYGLSLKRQPLHVVYNMLHVICQYFFWEMGLHQHPKLVRVPTAVQVWATEK